MTHEGTPGHGGLGTWARVLGAIIVLASPLLVLLLIPDLMRSRAGLGQTGLLIGLPIYFALVIVTAFLAPWVSARVAAEAPAWTGATVFTSIRALRRSRPVRFWSRVGTYVAVYALAQVLGFGFAELVPYAIEEVDAAGREGWRIEYAAYAAQALIVFAVIVAGLTGLAMGLRRDAIGLVHGSSMGLTRAASPSARR